MMQPWTWDVRFAGFMDRAALEGLADLVHRDPAPPAIDRDLDARGHDGILLRAAGEPDAQLRRDLLPSLGPVEALCGRFEDSPNPLVLEPGQPEGQRIDARRGGQLVHERFACEVVARGRQAAVRALGQRRIGADRRDSRIRDAVRRIDGRAAGVDVGEIPGDQRAVLRPGRPCTR